MKSLQQERQLKERSDSAVSATSTMALIPNSPPHTISTTVSSRESQETADDIGEPSTHQQTSAVNSSNELFFARTPS